MTGGIDPGEELRDSASGSESEIPERNSASGAGAGDDPGEELRDPGEELRELDLGLDPGEELRLRRTG